MTVLSDAPPASDDTYRASGASVFSADSGTDFYSDGLAADSATTLDSRRAARRSSGTRGVLLRRGHEDRWEPEVARSIGSSVVRAEAFNSRGSRTTASSSCSSRNAARLSMKSAGTRLAELASSVGTCVTDEEAAAAAERATKRRLEEKKEVLAAAAAKAADRAAKMAAKRAKAKHVQLRHELRIREAEVRKSALKAQHEHDQEVLHDIVARRKDAQRLIAEQEAQDDSLECVLRWALPDASAKVSDDDAVLNLMGKGAEKISDDEAVLKLMKKGTATVSDDDAVLKLMGKGTDKVSNDDAALKLLGKGTDKVSDDDAILNLMGKSTDKVSDDDAVLNLMGKDGGAKRATTDSAAVLKLMAKENRAEDIRDNEVALKLLRQGPLTDSTPINRLVVGSLDKRGAKDDEAFRRILDSAADHDEARINADALRFILGGTADPVTRLAHLARSRPQAGRNRAEADAKAAVRDLQVLDHLLEKNDLDNEIQAWKDVGAIHMLMNDLPGPDPEKRKRANQLQADSDAVTRFMNTPSPIPAQPNLLQPGTALSRLISQTSPHPEADSKVIQNLMSPHSRAVPASNADDGYIIQQLMSPGGSTFIKPMQSPSGPNMNLAGSNFAPPPKVGLMGMLSTQKAPSINEQDLSVARSLMNDRFGVSEVQSIRDVDMLHMLMQ